MRCFLGGSIFRYEDFGVMQRDVNALYKFIFKGQLFHGVFFLNKKTQKNSNFFDRNAEKDHLWSKMSFLL